MKFESSLEYARQMDHADPLSGYRDRFHLPMQKSGEPYVYLCGNSLGLQPKSTRAFVEQELKDWENLGVEGHIHARNPWLPYHEFLTEHMRQIVGGLPHEVVVMNTLSVNLHLMMASFYRPTTERFRIMIESDAFPSDLYAVESQVAFHGFDKNDGVLKLFPREGEVTLRPEDILETIEREGDSIALILLGNVNYYTGQKFDIRAITEAGHSKGCLVGFDLAHGAGNLKLDLHNDGPDFATWCTYKYLNSGPGSVGGCFIHERHAERQDIPRFAGWWGHDKVTRFNMRHEFSPIPGAEGWQLSNPPILSLAAIRASLSIFGEVGMDALVRKSRLLTGYMEFLIGEMGNDKINIITPTDPEQRGCQLSIQVLDADKALFDKIMAMGVIADWREPDVIRVAAVPLYNSFEDVYLFVDILKEALK